MSVAKRVADEMDGESLRSRLLGATVSVSHEWHLMNEMAGSPGCHLWPVF